LRKGYDQLFVEARKYVIPIEDNEFPAQKMKSLGIFSDVHPEVGQIFVAHVKRQGDAELLKPGRAVILEIIRATSGGNNSAA